MDAISVGEERLERTLCSGAWDAAASRRAADALAEVLTGVSRSQWPEIAWRFSNLTPDGYPVELSVASHDSSIRYSAEVAGPEVPNRLRLGYALDLLQRLGSSVPSEIAGQLSEIQAGGELEYGAWIGGRHTADRSRHKLYVEVPLNAHNADVFLGVPTIAHHTLLPGRPLLLCMLGYEPESGRRETYYMARRLSRPEIDRLLRLARLGHRLEDLLHVLGEIWGYSLSWELPWSRVGFSLSVVDGAPEALSIILPTWWTLGSDETVPGRLRDLSVPRGWHFDTYHALVREAASRGRELNHTTLAVTVGHAGPLAITIGLTPA